MCHTLSYVHHRARRPQAGPAWYDIVGRGRTIRVLRPKSGGPFTFDDLREAFEAGRVEGAFGGDSSAFDAWFREYVRAEE